MRGREVVFAKVDCADNEYALELFPNTGFCTLVLLQGTDYCKLHKGPLRQREYVYLSRKTR